MFETNHNNKKRRKKLRREDNTAKQKIMIRGRKFHTYTYTIMQINHLLLNQPNENRYVTKDNKK